MLSSIEARNFLVLPGEDSSIKTLEQATKKSPFERTSYALGQKSPLCRTSTVTTVQNKHRTTHCKACVSPQGLRCFWFKVVSVLCPESAKHKNLLK